MAGEPTPSGVNDALLGGNTSMAPDREAARRIAARFPSVPEMARAGHSFGLRTARWAASELGIRRFIRAGFVTTLPGRNVHDAVGAIAPDSRIVYVTRGDQAAMAVEMLGDGHRIAVARARVAQPAEVLAAPPVAAMLAERKPVCLIVGTLMHFAPRPGAGPYLADLAAPLPPGSVLAASLISAASDAAAAELGELFGMGVYAYTAREAAGWLDGMRVFTLTPGISEPGTALGVAARIP